MKDQKRKGTSHLYLLKVSLSAAAAAMLALIAADASAAVKWVRGSGHVVTETRTASGFSGVVLRGSGVLVIEQTGQESVSVSAEDNLLPMFQTYVEGRWLIIEPKANVFIQPTTGITFHVTLRTLDYIAAWGTAHVSAEGLNTPMLKVKLNGASDGRLIGYAGRQELLVTGSGSLDATALNGEEGKVALEGSGRVTVNTRKNLEVRLNGSGDVRYLGSPKLDSKAHGSGAVLPLLSSQP